MAKDKVDKPEKGATILDMDGNVINTEPMEETAIPSGGGPNPMEYQVGLGLYDQAKSDGITFGEMQNFPPWATVIGMFGAIERLQAQVLELTARLNALLGPKQVAVEEADWQPVKEPEKEVPNVDE